MAMATSASALPLSIGVPDPARMSTVTGIGDAIGGASGSP
jgi:hypothetical protein